MKGFLFYLFFCQALLLYSNEGSFTDDSMRKSFCYINPLQLIFISEPDFGYERPVKNNLSVNVNIGYKFENVLGLIQNINGGGAVRYSYQGPRLTVCLKNYTSGRRFFYGFEARGSFLKINDRNFSESAKTEAGHIYGLTSDRRDLDLGIIFGKTNFRNKQKLQVYVVLGVRAVWATSTYTSITNGASGIGGAVVPFTAPIINGYMSYGLFQLGITRIFFAKKK